jgi:hypothetical protein
VFLKNDIDLIKQDGFLIALETLPKMSQLTQGIVVLVLRYDECCHPAADLSRSLRWKKSGQVGRCWASSVDFARRSVESATSCDAGDSVVSA